MEVSVQSYGERGFFLNKLTEHQRWCLLDAANQNPPIGLEEAVPGYDKLLLLFRGPVDRSVVQVWLAAQTVTQHKSRGQGREHRVSVVYDGPDLEAIAEKTGLTIDGVVSQHAEVEYRVHMGGFAPGFFYLEGLRPALHLPRRATPRNRIEPGTVAIGGPHTGIYSVASPGGWHLLGRTNHRLFNPERARIIGFESREVFPVQTGDRLRFEVVKELPDD